ncbi:MAG: efflux RND transporter periplasmic adaptor subunit [Pseudomonadales bacterium]|jgi:membrane fusion protein (multidrug efflux system)|nr:efflux RND transporter periplasmic adaptor subunit [Cellvibrionales bacterium]MBP8029753.1 efflux RND transporter periplasmic adaptor subunit [Pseudomonadales bacterium]
MRRYNSLIIIAAVLLLLLLYVVTGHFGIGGDKKAKAPYQLLVTVEKASLEELRDTVAALGTTASNESIDVSATVTATVRSVHFEDGGHVEKNAVLVELDADEARAEVEQVRANLAEEERQLRHLKLLIDRKAVSQTDMEKQQSVVNVARAKLAANEARLQDYTIRAPFSGVLGARRVSVGALVSPGTVITSLDDLARIKVDFSVPEIYLPLLKEGLFLQAYSQAYSDKVFAGTVSFVDSRIDPVTRAVALRAQLDNRDMLLRPGMLLQVKIQQSPRRALMVPERAIAPLRGEQFVYVLDSDAEGKPVAHRRTVKLGQRMGGRVEITSGIAENEVVIVDGSMSVQDGMGVTVQESAVKAGK